MSDGVTVLLQFFQHNYSWLAQLFRCCSCRFAHEDLAIILGAYVVVNKIMPVGLVALCIYGGMVVSDFALYGAGAGARRALARTARGRRPGAGLRGHQAQSVWVGGALSRRPASFSCLHRVRVDACRSVASPLPASLCLRSICRSCCAAVFFGDALDERAGF